MGKMDRAATTSIQGRPDWLRPFLLAVTIVGSPALIMPLAFMAGIFYMQSGYERIGIALLFVCLASAINGLLKQLLRRSRPDTPYVKGMWPQTYSFPSGHAFTSALLYGLVAYLGYKHLPEPLSVLAPVVFIALIMAIGFSRVYLGAHYVLDVLGGWLLASALLLIVVDFLG